MNTESWNERIRDDESLTDNLTDDEALEILTWASQALELCTSDDECHALVERIRGINRAVAGGARFPTLMQRLRGSSRHETHED